MPQLWHALDNPTDQLVADCRYASSRHFLDDTRLLRDSLGQLVTGALAGLFDGHTTIDVDWRAPIQSLSLSRLEPLGDDAVGIALTCLNSWGRGMREVADPGDVRIVVRDESWKQLRLGVEAVKSFDADLRLSRSDRRHPVSPSGTNPPTRCPPATPAPRPSPSPKTCCTWPTSRSCTAKTSPSPKTSTGSSASARSPSDLVTGWAMQGKGRALWCVGDQHYKVQTVLHPAEHALTYTNDAIQTAA